MTTTKLIPIALAAAAIIGTFAACHKSDDTPASVPLQYTNLTDMGTALGPQRMTGTIDATTGGSFRGNSGTRYVFAPGSFRFANGSTVSGNVEVQAMEVLNKADMMYSGILPYSNGAPLISGGELEVSATQNGQAVYLAPGHYLSANIPQGGMAPTGMQAFFGRGIENAGANKVNWTLPDTTSGTGNNNHFGYIVTNGDTVQLFSDSLGLCNADQFLTNPQYQSFNVHLAGLPSSTTREIRAYAFYDGRKSAWNMYGTVNAGSNTFSEGHVPNIPVHFVVLCIANGKFYGGIAAATPATGTTYTVNMSEQSPAVFKALVAAL